MRERCPKTLRRSKVSCARPAGHTGRCKSEKNIASTKRWRAEHIELVRERGRSYFHKHSVDPAFRAARARRNAVYQKHRYENDPTFRLKHEMARDSYRRRRRVAADQSKDQ